MAVSPHKEQHLTSQNFIGSYKKSVVVLDELQDTKNIEGRKLNKLRRNISDQD